MLGINFLISLSRVVSQCCIVYLQQLFLLNCSHFTQARVDLNPCECFS